MIRRALIVATLTGLALASLPPVQADIIRDSTGQRRAELDRLELTKFSTESWSKLSGWINGAAPTAASTDGKAILIMSFSTWQPASAKAAGIAQNMLTKYGAKGLIVIGVHNKQGFDSAAADAKAKGWNFPIANDPAGEFRSALKIDHDPEFYFVDRAGHLRYAAVATSSVEEACAELVDESREQANDLPRIRKEREDKATADGRKTSNINTTVDLSTLPPVPPGYIPPSAAEYKVAEWPKMDKELAEKWGLIDGQTKKFKDTKIAFTPMGYFPAKPELQGRAIVIYLWHPDVVESYGKVMPQMDLLQQSHQRDLAVIGAAIPIASLDSARANNNANGEKDETPEKLRPKYLSFLSNRTFKHALAADFAGTSLSSVVGTNGGGTGFPLPGAMIVSSDGIIRWIGWTNNADFKYAIDQIIAVDPAVRARQRADRAFIEKAK